MNGIEWLCLMHLQALMHLRRLLELMEHEQDEESRKPVRAQCMKINTYLAQCLLHAP